MQIHKVHKVVLEFIEDMFPGEVNITQVQKEEKGWEVKVEVYEASSFIKSIGLSTDVKDRNFYIIRLDKDLEVVGYERADQ